jgi:hypothetical protein
VLGILSLLPPPSFPWTRVNAEQVGLAAAAAATRLPESMLIVFHDRHLCLMEWHDFRLQVCLVYQVQLQVVLTNSVV